MEVDSSPASDTDADTDNSVADIDQDQDNHGDDATPASSEQNQ